MRTLYTHMFPPKRTFALLKATFCRAPATCSRSGEKNLAIFVADGILARDNGNVAIARYLNTYDDVYHGQHRSRSVICSDTWANEDGAWKLLANHCSQKKQQRLFAVE